MSVDKESERLEFMADIIGELLVDYARPNRLIVKGKLNPGRTNRLIHILIFLAHDITDPELRIEDRIELAHSALGKNIPRDVLETLRHYITAIQ